MDRKQEDQRSARTVSLSPVPVFPDRSHGSQCVVQIEPQDKRIEDVLDVLRQEERPIVIVLPNEHVLFAEQSHFNLVKDVFPNKKVAFLLPKKQVKSIGPFVKAAGLFYASHMAQITSHFLSVQQPAVGTSTVRPTHDFGVQQETDELVLPKSLTVGSSEPTTPLPTSFPSTAAPPSSAKKQWVLFRIASVGVLLLILSAATVQSLFFPPQHLPTLSATRLVGTLSFVSSGQLDPGSATGVNDEISLNLSGLTAPHTGMGYFVWMQTDKTPSSTGSVLLGKLLIGTGMVHFTYRDKHHVDLLATYSHFLITEQQATPTPTQPSLDTNTWRYVASIPDIPTPGDEQKFSLLSHLRHLLASDQTLQTIGLQGGLDIWLFRNIGKVFEWSNAARDDFGKNEANLIRSRTDSIVQYLDGQVYAYRVLPPGTPWQVDQKAGRPGILDFDTAQDELGPPSYISHVRLHLMGLINAPGHTAAQVQLAEQLDGILTQMERFLKQTRSDAIRLAKMNNTQLQQPAAMSLLDDMQLTSYNAFVGQANLTTGQVQNGEVSLHVLMQRLASIAISTYTRD